VIIISLPALMVLFQLPAAALVGRKTTTQCDAPFARYHFDNVLGRALDRKSDILGPSSSRCLSAVSAAILRRRIELHTNGMLSSDATSSIAISVPVIRSLRNLFMAVITDLAAGWGSVYVVGRSYLASSQITLTKCDLWLHTEAYGSQCMRHYLRIVS
jgi:hypothetical protein